MGPEPDEVDHAGASSQRPASGARAEDLRPCGNESVTRLAKRRKGARGLAIPYGQSEALELRPVKLCL
jgi:hypothetical protein